MIYNDVYFEHVSVRNGNTNILTFHKKKTHIIQMTKDFLVKPQ